MDKDNTVTEYKLISASTTYDLDRIICEKLAIGWRLYGNPMVTYSANGNYNHSQAVVR